jgi:hypothetical protein
VSIGTNISIRGTTALFMITLMKDWFMFLDQLKNVTERGNPPCSKLVIANKDQNL